MRGIEQFRFVDLVWVDTRWQFDPPGARTLEAQAQREHLALHPRVAVEHDLTVFEDVPYGLVVEVMGEVKDAGIEKPEDLRGKNVGIATYQSVPGVWNRGMFQHDHGVHPSEMTFWREKEEAPQGTRFTSHPQFTPPPDSVAPSG